MNLAEHAEAMARSAHPGWAATALDGLQHSLELLDEKRIKVVINGGSLNPKGLAEEILKLVCLDHFSCLITTNTTSHSCKRRV